MKSWGSAQAVIAALRDDAAADVERLEQETASAIEALEAEVGHAAPPADAAARLEEARQRANDSDAAEDVEDVIAAAADRDAWIAAAAARARAEIVSAPDSASWVSTLAVEALAHLPSTACVLVVPALPDVSTDAWRRALEQQTGKSVTLEIGGVTAGCLARTADGRVTFDNTLDARERRTRTAWRAALAAIYDAAIARPQPAAAEPARQPESAGAVS